MSQVRGIDILRWGLGIMGNISTSSVDEMYSSSNINFTLFVTRNSFQHDTARNVVTGLTIIIANHVKLHIIYPHNN